MIYLDSSGRLGNQFFQYAYARKLQVKTKQAILIKFKTKHSFGKDGDDGWGNSLEYFKTKGCAYTKGSYPLWLTKSNILQIVLGSMWVIYNRLFSNYFEIQSRYIKQLKWCPVLNKLGLFWLHVGFYNFDNYTNRDLFLKGSYESPDYFNDIRSELLEEFEPIQSILDQNIQLYDNIVNSNSVCVTIRSFKEIQSNSTFSNLYNVCTPQYFMDAISLLNEKLKKPRFFIFSDDIKWVKEKMDFSNFDVVFEPNDNPIWEKLRLMYNCKHFVISNSTFSWWAQYLSRNSEKIVVSPRKWYNDDYESPLIDKSWITL